MNASLDSLVYGDKSDNANKRHLLVCDNCCWCLSYLPDLENDEIEYFDKCPYCDEETRSMFISEKASEKSDTKHIQNAMTQFESWAFRNIES
jgi:hypothetical protein